MPVIISPFVSSELAGSSFSERDAACRSRRDWSRGNGKKMVALSSLGSSIISQMKPGRTKSLSQGRRILFRPFLKVSDLGYSAKGFWPGRTSSL
jgi:uncharacterized protein (DUF2147 family)